MEFTPVGALCVIAILLVIARPLSWGVALLGAFLPLQVAASVNLPALGGSSIITIHVLVGAFLLAFLLRPALASALFADARGRAPTVIFAVFFIYAAMSAFVMPRLFQGVVDVFSLSRPEHGTLIVMSPLKPTSSNITQAFYIGINFVLFASLAFVVGRAGGARAGATLVASATVVHLVFAAVSAFPHFGPTAAVLDFIRTANYAIASHHTIGGVPRIIGSYPEPSSFGAMSAGLLAYNAVRFAQRPTFLSGAATAGLLGCVVTAMSSTSYAVLAVIGGLFMLRMLVTMISRGVTAEEQMVLVAAGVLVILATTLFFFLEPARAFASRLFDVLFASKMQSYSGIERSSWNMQSLRNLVETYGLGVGLGSARASSLVTALLGNVGVIGAVLYASFLGSSFLRRSPTQGDGESSADFATQRRLFEAARAGAFALLLSQLISGGTVDGGSQFFAFAAVAAAAFRSARTAPSTAAVISTRTSPRGRFFWAGGGATTRFPQAH
ncbi:MAG: hypothetical protein K2Q06_08825 [Parvularculaceae bacterium]|nr:hypothetical protein [Parvularculaceae bacterium]